MIPLDKCSKIHKTRPLEFLPKCKIYGTFPKFQKLTFLDFEFCPKIENLPSLRNNLTYCELTIHLLGTALINTDNVVLN